MDHEQHCFSADKSRISVPQKVQGAAIRQAAFQPNDRAALLAAVFADAPLGFALFDQDLRYAYINTFLADLNGLPPEEHLGRSIAEVLPGVAPLVEPILKQVLETGKAVINVEVSGEPASLPGRQRHVLASYYPIELHESGQCGVGAVIVEITRQKELEQELSRRERELKRIVENAPDIIARFDRNMRHLFVNPAVERATGISSQDFIGKSNAELGVPPEIYRFWHIHLNQVFQTGQKVTIEFDFPTPTGTRYYESHLVPELASDGTVESVLSMTRDITDLKRAQERMRFLAEASVLLSTSLDYSTTLDNVARLVVPNLADFCVVDLIDAEGMPSGLVVAHRDPAKEELLRQIRQQMPVSPDYPGSPIGQVIRTRRPVYIPEVPESLFRFYIEHLTHLDDLGSLIPGSLIAVPLISRDRLWGVLTLGISTPGFYTPEDLSMTEELARRAAIAIDNASLYQDACQAIQLRDQFLSVVAHELKTPVTALLGYAQLLQRRLKREQLLNPRDQQAFDRLAEQVARLHDMTNGLLDLSRIQAGTLTFDPRPLDVGEVVRRLVEELQLTLEHHRIDISDPDEPLLIEGDEMRLRQVFSNLLQNAVKYSPQHSEVTVELARHGKYVSIAVRDYGIGIPAEDLQNIFTLFYRASNTKRTGLGGIGVGLAVVKEVIVLHGGSVEVESTEGAGSTFRVLLPAL